MEVAKSVTCTFIWDLFPFFTRKAYSYRQVDANAENIYLLNSFRWSYFYRTNNPENSPRIMEINFYFGSMSFSMSVNSSWVLAWPIRHQRRNKRSSGQWHCYADRNLNISDRIWNAAHDVCRLFMGRTTAWVYEKLLPTYLTLNKQKKVFQKTYFSNISKIFRHICADRSKISGTFFGPLVLICASLVKARCSPIISLNCANIQHCANLLSFKECASF